MRNFQILSVSPAFGGATPEGASGAYEVITAVAHGALDPHASSNTGLVDLVNAPAAADGLVDYSSDVVILRPVNSTDANRLLVYEVVNRGRKLAIPSFLGASPDGQALPKKDFPSLLASGGTIVWSGWQGDLPLNGTSAIAGSALIGTRFPQARQPDGKPVTGMNRDEFIPDYAGGPPDRIPLSYSPADPADRKSVTFTARQSWLSDYGRSPSGHPSYDAPSVPVSMWHYAVGKNGATDVVFTPPADVPGPAGTRVPGDAGTIYSFVYRAKDPMVDGIGFAAVRDLVAFLRAGKPDAAGHPDPLADLTGAHCILASCQNKPAGTVDVAVAVGISQSGRFLRDFLYQGFNDDGGNLVFDGLMPIIAGARRTWVNERFAQPGRWSKEHEDHWQVGDQFPFTYDLRLDPFSRRVDGLLRACQISQTCPKIMQVDGAFEWWGARASLVVTDGKGHDVKLPANVRYYLIAGTKHGGGEGLGDGVVHLPAPGSACQLPDSPVSEGPAERALLRALLAWTEKGTLPPQSAYPTAANRTAVLPAHALPALHDLMVPIDSAATPTKLPFAWPQITRSPRHPIMARFRMCVPGPRTSCWFPGRTRVVTHWLVSACPTSPCLWRPTQAGTFVRSATRWAKRACSPAPPFLSLSKRRRKDREIAGRHWTNFTRGGQIICVKSPRPRRIWSPKATCCSGMQPRPTSTQRVVYHDV